MRFRSFSFVLGCALFSAAESALAQTCISPPPDPDCASLVVGAALPFPNGTAPETLTLPAGTTAVDLVILGHSENRRYDDFLQPMVAANPPLPGVSFTVSNLYIGGHEAFEWAAPGNNGYDQIEDVIQQFTQNPVIVLGLFSNNVTHPITNPVVGDANYDRFVADLLAIADHVHNAGQTAVMVYLSAHRYKPSNVLPAWHENCALATVMEQAEATGRGYVKPGPAQHDLHRCCFPTCYHPDMSHTNMEGDALMAQTWYDFLVRELTGVDPSVTSYCSGKTGSVGCAPFLSTTGAPAASSNAGFFITAHDAVPGEAGFLLYSFQKANLGFHGGTLCVKAPFERVLPPKIAKAADPPPCSGRLRTDFSKRFQSGADPLLSIGQTVFTQYFQRDPADPAGFGDGLTDAVRFVITP